MNSIQIVNQEDIRFLTSKDSVIQRIDDEYGAPHDWRRKPDFESLSKIILGQQVSLESAESHFNKLKNYIGKFDPKNILKLSDEEMRSCFISRQKSKYLRELSDSILSRKIIFEEFGLMNDDKIREKLISIKGIGSWTADVFMLFCLQSKDIFPIGDIAVINTVKELYEVAERDEILQIAERWKPCRSLATFYMWHYYLTKRGRIAIY